MSRPTRIRINLQALQHNLKKIRSIAPKSSILAMVKSNAYGHGIERIALALPNADALGVACLEEGLRLREVGVKNPIVLMEGLFHPDELLKTTSGNFRLVVHNFEQVKMLEETRHRLSIPVWLKIDTGMHRLGFNPNEAAKAYHRLMKCEVVEKPVGLMTHFAESDSLDKTPTLRQIDIFNKSTTGLSGPRSLANSGAILEWPSTHEDWVRPGIILYGASPFSNKIASDFGLQPVMSLTSELIAIHDLVKGEKVGYGGVWTCPANGKIGIVAIGYGDGYPRHAQNGTPILVNGKNCHLVGRVSMDMLAVDLESQPNAKPGDPVILWGEGLPVEKVAAGSDTTAYELLTRITQRVHVVVT